MELTGEWTELEKHMERNPSVQAMKPDNLTIVAVFRGPARNGIVINVRGVD